MTNLPSQNDTVAPISRLRLPSAVFWMLVSAPLLIALGAFITVAMQPYVTVRSPEGDAVLMAWFGAVLLCLGAAFLIAGIALVGVRSMLRQQTEVWQNRTVDDTV